MGTRFDYVKYDEQAQFLQDSFKKMFVNLEQQIEAMPAGRYKALALTKLEECYMFIGKVIRDDQIERNKVDFVQTELQEERSNL